MKNELAWKTIPRNGLSRYKISEIGEIRKIYNGKNIKSWYDEKRREYVFLRHYGREKKFFVNDLLKEAFGVQKIEDEYIPDIKFMDKPEQFSENEEDYGRGDNSKYWEEIRDQAKRATARKTNEKHKK